MKGCKDCPVYEKCEVTYRSSACEALRASYEVHSDPEVVTNADKIRSMTDEKLAEFLERCEGEGYQDSSITPTNEYGYHMDMLEWLKQPAEGE